MAINRTGSSSLRLWMQTHDVAHRMARYRENEERKLSLISKIDANGWDAFTVVRNPWDRAVSSWKYCIEKKRLGQCTFKEFLRIPCQKMTPQQSYHSGPQWAHVVDAEGKIDHLDHVGRFEDLGATCRWIAKTRGIPCSEDLPHLKKTQRRIYTEHYDEELVELVFRTFRRDIEMFGYEYGG